MSLPSEKADASTDIQTRSSSRERKLTEKGQTMHSQNIKRHEMMFNKDYHFWKLAARLTRTTLKSVCSTQELNKLQQDIQAKHDTLRLQYESILRKGNTTPEIVNKMDACITLTKEISDLISNRLRTVDEDYNDQLEKERVREVLNKNEHGSIFGHTITETSSSSKSSERSSSHSSSESTNNSKADAQAELAAKLEQSKAVKEIQAQRAHLQKLENKWKLKEAKMLSEIRQKEVQMKQQLEEERAKLQQLQAEKEVAVAEARVRAYDDFEGFENQEEELSNNVNYACFRTKSEAQLNPNAASFHPYQGAPEVTMTQESVSLAQAIASSLSMSRLPVPEPTTFSGDPLRFTDWKLTFMTLIDRKSLPSSEKMFYLKNYLAGEAQKAVQGFFYRDSESAYKGAWKVLEDRYGNPFIIQKAFRDKLMRWPKINTNDPLALREFADFLQSCTEAIPHVKGLAILNDCEENHKMLKKLPEWIVRKWSRIVVDELDMSGSYPDFVCFTEFLNKEARIACNPIASPMLMNFKPTDEKLPKRAKALNTNTQAKRVLHEKQEANSTKPKLPCPVCKNETHGIAQCPTFTVKSAEEKKAFIQENHLCFGCLRKGHVTKVCKRRHTCNICSRRHPTCLHEDRKQNPVDELTNSSTSTEGDVSHEMHKVVSHTSTQRAPATSSIVPVFVSSVQEPHREVLTYAILDTQSDSTFVLEDVLDKLNVEVRPVKLKLSTMTAMDTVISSKSVCGLQVRGLNSEDHIQLQQAYSRNFIPVDKSYIPTKETAISWPHLRHLADKLPLLQDCDVGLLIGYDCPSALVPFEVIIGGKNEPFAQRGTLGWSIIGSSNPHLDRQGSHSFVHRLTVKQLQIPSPADVLKSLESDFIERTYEEKYVSQNDVQFIQLLSDHITQKEDGHYEMPLPFKGNSPPNLPNNKRLATIRLQCLKRKLKANKQYYEQYKTFMEETIKKGDAEPAPTTSEGETEWYLPHHGVYHPRKPEKLRVVFDCAAKFHGLSLNDTLLTGPDLINPLVGVLCRFRKEAVAIICDIERMFYQFSVTPEFRNYLKFLWWQDGDVDKEVQEYRMTVHLFGAASSPGCANFGLKHLAHRYKADYPIASTFVEKHFYVDDGLVSVQSVADAKKLITEAQELCKRGGLHLHKFNSNKEAALTHLNPSEKAANIEHLSFDSVPSERALGIQWSVNDDTFGFDISLKDQPPTRRSCLSVIASLYDPLGFIAPFSLSGKLILQELCHRGTGWDDPLPDDMKPRWEEWMKGLHKLKEVSIPRCYHPHDFHNIVRVELHHFSDASCVGYGVCSYLRYQNDTNEVHCNLVLAKARVAPSKVTSIPRLELMAAVVSTKVSIMLKSELDMKVDQEVFWTDSRVVLGYINNDARRFHIFVANRVQLIRDNSSPSQWHYVDTSENPADHASRGLRASDLHTTSWLKGPKFLWESELHLTPTTSTELLVGDPEVEAIQVLATKVNHSNDILSRLSRFSSWIRLLKVVARIKRLKSSHKHSDHVTVEEHEKAAEAVIKIVQQQAFPHEFKALQSKNVLPSSSALFKLDPILSEGLICVGGRLKNSSLGHKVKHPTILPNNSHITKLIVSHYHAKTMHQGRGQTQMELRSNGFWVIGGSKLVAKCIHTCVLCRKLRRPTENQKMAELPKERVEASAPFTYSGMDCFGPFIVKKARKENKKYGLIFTCLYSRAVHIEMLDDLSTDSFINALRCFISIRGAVRQLYCDQGSNFVGAKNEFKEALKQCDSKLLEIFLTEKQCEFVFNAPSASHTGGVWERQIRTVRKVLNATFAQCPRRLDDASLRTMLYEAMAIVNSRPLTVDGINDPQALEPITPNHLIMMKSKVALPPPGVFVKEDLYATKRWRRVQYLIEQFWSRWRKEYLLNISTRQRWHLPQRNLKVNDIVIIKDDNLPRCHWQLGLVVEVVQGSDGLVRRAKVRVGERNHQRKQGPPFKHSVIERPVQKLVLLLEN
ncbi:uncharacterized protein LOC129193043 isoform X1 [Dunckerocampus dactyliophorus]|uniref:uncharacterized protein LOC129193043 isoform X1 n=2 Tax=Dunckerocampus dactyliophorus TaxID=161453 RepID=UPI0024052DD1|nr:uncharacterized protein LOC129193043 isoform X1 [Dunckerocampus dactyliophorus]XP_054653605.1 uncharacterized protein LOC129193043 isoform X1 [Dunckerocampus dactyliophorus]XP_054653606.1 uncharacterized protein LOC129193043 isoform X1 [Dunckerocampus dactyliophorus]XP_054653607.1 uncharacterized protein LOC129193043 isoform X1 [Dunckerocampus dactyliophorus]XP_054653608.1 uncharacterized protein LOC129193043 isoform X1 [Dunckerocampus dactyliophorus]